MRGWGGNWSFPALFGYFVVGQSLAAGATNTAQNDFQTADKILPVSSFI
jgi:hypothetical protein